MLIIFGGLPGTGKTTLSKQIAKQLNAVYLRIDTVEQVLKKCSNSDHLVGPEGYMVCYAVALDNLKLGLPVVADSVNPIAITRDDWQKVALDANKPFIEIELVCSNTKEHQRRIETRETDIPGHKLPKWVDVLNRDYEPWQSKSVTLDTSKYSVDESVKIIMDFINRKS
ncbi:TPA: AAA family ATPase [Legionella pneumophila]|uniref:AAA family ATPase n=1 Tax=Legionella pneumophila TaxID=446 RepID=UPI000CEB33DC|nr:AAA family ATPase [Legionella pneumophila]PPK32530.1 adenylyl-sulfate kinase [Legionella pneumophila]HAT2073454.1 AAA family ATPase [Legionella pneumophila]HAU0283106.1 AAA family ATPase [Legionella pneumophila]HAU0306389.1 AAA family ATPase [Legionella pneumophila]